MTEGKQKAGEINVCIDGIEMLIPRGRCKRGTVKLMTDDKVRTNCANRKFKRNDLIALVSFGFFHRSTCSPALT